MTQPCDMIGWPLDYKPTPPAPPRARFTRSEMALLKLHMENSSPEGTNRWMRDLRK